MRRKCLAIAVILFLFSVFVVFKGCAHGEEFHVPTYCVPDSISAAWAWRVQRGDEVRIALSRTTCGDHAQAMALNINIWTYIETTCNNGTVFVLRLRRNVLAEPCHYTEPQPYRHASLPDFVNEQSAFVR